LRNHGQVQVSPFMLRARITDNGDPYELTVFTNGRAIVKGTKQPEVARGIYARYVGS
jgi:adenylyltransferase/sulfurtransferase